MTTQQKMKMMMMPKTERRIRKNPRSTTMRRKTQVKTLFRPRKTLNKLDKIFCWRALLPLILEEIEEVEEVEEAVSLVTYSR